MQLSKNIEDVTPKGEFRLEVYSHVFSRHCVIKLFTDEASLNRDGINNLRNVHTWSHRNPHATCVTHFQRRISVNMWCGVLGNRLIGLFFCLKTI